MAVYLSNKEVDQLVDPAELVEDVERVLRSTGVVAPARLGLEHRGSWLGVMPSAGQGFYAVKVVGVYPGNPGRGLPLVRGRLFLVDAETGELLLEADAEAATGWRTAAATAVALRLLGGTGGVLGVLGAGVQASYHLRLLTRLYRYEHVMVYSPTRNRAEKLAAQYGGEVAEPGRLLREADTVIAATTSREPVVLGRLLRSGAVVASVGAPRPVRELDQDTLARAQCVLVDTRKGVLSESDDVGEKLVEVVELGEALRGVKNCMPGEIRVYKSVGTAILDLAIALHLYRRLGHQDS
ncbi:ornithine cyclodeaminase family protein [Pyrodictium delaneyi]|uniref:ornithine cyclodeaminase family protein n=1 Tax=Pyrodictium delaneyi TaxID=1273541 RepID=UPI001C5B6757|nr:ornithine cyclodeaminase family protein [Pyrodictium delaneyi]